MTTLERAARPSFATAAPFEFPPFTPARRVRAELAAGILRSGQSLPDEAFDQIYPNAVTEVSAVHWTPVRVCARIVELLRLPPGARLLDIGAGVGKFCIVTAAMMPRVRVRGIERYAPFVRVAHEAARRLGVEVDIEHGDFADHDADGIEAVYLFNPFKETIRLAGLREGIPANTDAPRVAADIAAAERFLACARPGLRVVTYCGFGGRMPPGYVRVARETRYGGTLELWRKFGPLQLKSVAPR